MSLESCIIKGSIPVHTGEPWGGRTGRHTARVYPRTHGGTTWRSGRKWTGGGLSPYTRGNPSRGFYVDTPRGSIPVHTGEPSKTQAERVASGVYPRTHGGTPLY